ncbi:hypothetical protein FNV43_RR10523 [Rhamnella rubrinervis]|uniref:NAC domain-containing protein n=1 Tax=Rhamnella rubrinervis TaxID=2594499 RepID=A0A8K0H409_9ROSA|nr:hypothetical protein FNV43_RR10523 [Rhamnella rubrinervis]
MVSSDAAGRELGDKQVWPPGFRFHPTDDELVLYYLKRKICRRKLKLDIIAETDVYKWDPEELPGLSKLKSGDRQWFFFSPRDRKYPNGARSNRATRHGYWKATGKDRNITCNARTVGVKKTLVFYKGRAPSGERTDWVMHEYTLDEEEFKRCQNVKEYYALYKVYKKSGPGPKNGEQYGAPFREEDWDEECPDFNNSVNPEVPVKKVNEVISNGDVRVDGQIQSPLNDIEEFMKRITEDPVLDEPHINNYAYTLSQVMSEQETQSTMVDPSSRDIIFPEPVSSNIQRCNVQGSFDFTESATSQLQFHETSEVTSAPNIHEQEPLVLAEEDFLEMDDLIGSEPNVVNTDKSLTDLQFEGIDGLGELDLYQDAGMFLNEVETTNQEGISHPYLNSLQLNMVNQFDYQLQADAAGVSQVNNQMYPGVDPSNNLLYTDSGHINNQLYLDSIDQIGNQFYPDGASQIDNQLWAHDHQEIDNNASADLNYGPSSGVVCDPPNYLVEGNQNQYESDNKVNGATSRLSSALWAFVESIPTTPASAAENALVNRAFERMSSFSRVRLNARNTNVVAGNQAETVVRKAGGGKRGFIFLPILVAVCAILWVLIGTVRIWGRSIPA